MLSFENKLGGRLLEGERLLETTRYYYLKFGGEEKTQKRKKCTR